MVFNELSQDAKKNAVQAFSDYFDDEVSQRMLESIGNLEATRFIDVDVSKDADGAFSLDAEKRKTPCFADGNDVPPKPERLKQTDDTVDQLFCEEYNKAVRSLASSWNDIQGAMKRHPDALAALKADDRFMTAWEEDMSDYGDAMDAATDDDAEFAKLGKEFKAMNSDVEDAVDDFADDDLKATQDALDRVAEVLSEESERYRTQDGVSKLSQEMGVDFDEDGEPTNLFGKTSSKSGDVEYALTRRIPAPVEMQEDTGVCPLCHSDAFDGRYCPVCGFHSDRADEGKDTGDSTGTLAYMLKRGRRHKSEVNKSHNMMNANCGAFAGYLVYDDSEGSTWFFCKDGTELKNTLMSMRFGEGFLTAIESSFSAEELDDIEIIDDLCEKITSENGSEVIDGSGNVNISVRKLYVSHPCGEAAPRPGEMYGIVEWSEKRKQHVKRLKGEQNMRRMSGSSNLTRGDFSHDNGDECLYADTYVDGLRLEVSVCPNWMLGGDKSDPYWLVEVGCIGDNGEYYDVASDWRDDEDSAIDAAIALCDDITENPDYYWRFLKEGRHMNRKSSRNVRRIAPAARRKASRTHRAVDFSDNDRYVRGLIEDAAQSVADDGPYDDYDSYVDAVNYAVDDACMYYDNIYAFSRYYGKPDTQEIVYAFNDDLFSDIDEAASQMLDGEPYKGASRRRARRGANASRRPASRRVTSGWHKQKVIEDVARAMIALDGFDPDYYTEREMNNVENRVYNELEEIEGIWSDDPDEARERADMLLEHLSDGSFADVASELKREEFGYIYNSVARRRNRAAANMNRRAARRH